MRKLLLAATALLVLGGAAKADVLLTLSGSVTDHSLGPQSTSAPCIICGSPPGGAQPAGFGYNDYKNTGNAVSHNLYSDNTSSSGNTTGEGVLGTFYTVGQIKNAVNANGIDVLIDVNTTSAASETLQLFEVFDVHNGVTTRIAHYDGPTLIGNIANNGNGFGDWILSGVGIAANLPLTDQIYFHAVWNGAVDGAEHFWLQGDNTCPTCTPTQQGAVPEPSTWAMMILGFAGIGFVAYRRSRKDPGPALAT